MRTTTYKMSPLDFFKARSSLGLNNQANKTQAQIEKCHSKLSAVSPFPALNGRRKPDSL